MNCSATAPFRSQMRFVHTAQRHNPRRTCGSSTDVQKEKLETDCPHPRAAARRNRELAQTREQIRALTSQLDHGLDVARASSREKSSYLTFRPPGAGICRNNMLQQGQFALLRVFCEVVLVGAGNPPMTAADSSRDSVSVRARTASGKPPNKQVLSLALQELQWWADSGSRRARGDFIE